jgi:transposase-like protein
MSYTTSAPYAECPRCAQSVGLSPIELHQGVHYQYVCRKCKIDFVTPELQEEMSNKCLIQQSTEKSESQKS